MDEAAPQAAAGETGTGGGLAVGSGFYLAKSDGTHQAFPVRGSYVSERTGEPANLMNAAGYPVTAECHWCHWPVRLVTLNQMEWVHVRPAAASGAP